MRNPKILFELTSGEILYLKHIFFEEMHPIYFLCESDKKSLFVCVLFDDRNGFKWLISPTKKGFIMDMIYNKLSVYDIFKKSKCLGESFLLYQKGNEEECKKVRFDTIEEVDLPTKGEFFNADLEEIKDCYEAVWETNLEIGYKKEAEGDIGKREIVTMNLVDMRNQMLLLKQECRLRRGA